MKVINVESYDNVIAFDRVIEILLFQSPDDFVVQVYTLIVVIQVDQVVYCQIIADIVLEEKWLALRSVENKPLECGYWGLSGNVEENVVLGIQCFCTVN